MLDILRKEERRLDALQAQLTFTLAPERKTNRLYPLSASFLPRHLLQQLPHAGLHPELGILAVRELKPPGQVSLDLALGRRVEEEALHVERRKLVVLVHLHREDAVRRPGSGIQRGVAAANGHLKGRNEISPHIA